MNYYLNLKSNNKINGKSVSAARHERYISREGEYKSDKAIKNKEIAYRDCLTGKNPIIKTPQQERLLYESPFGNIKQDENGIYISKGASVETVAIALSVAEKIYGNEISVKGSEIFKEKNIKAASELKLPVKFLHRSLEKQCKTEKERLENDRREFENNGGRYNEPRVRVGGRRNEDIQKPRTKLRSLEDLAEGGFNLPRLHERDVDSNSKRDRVLLSGDEIALIRNRQRELSDRVRWDTAPARKRIIEETTANILTNINYTDEVASSHIQYITRDSIYSHKGGCVFISNQLPKWAEGDSKKFWEAADLFERKNGEVYKELVCSLPNVLSLSDQKKIIEKFLDKHLKNFYYTYAIHNKIGALSGEEEHPHAHIMFSTREIDGYEKNTGRTPDKFFSRYNSKNPEKGGCKKADKWRDKDRTQYLYELRYDFAKITNEVLEENGIHIRVDPRSLEEQRQNALMEGNELLVKVLDRVPEKYVKEFATITDEKNPLVVEHRENRQKVKQKIKNIEDSFINDVAEEKRKLSEIWEEVQRKREIINEVYNDLPENLQKSFEEFVGRMNESASEITARRSVTNDASNSFHKAVMDFLDYDAKNSFEALQKCAKEKRQWEYFEKTLNVPTERKEVLEEIKKEINTNISILNSKIKRHAKECRPYFDALAKDKKMHGLIRAQGIEYINQHRVGRNDLKRVTFKAIHDVKVADRALKLYLKREAHKNPKTTNDVWNRVVEELTNTEVKIQKVCDEIKNLQKQIISPARAIYIARDVYTKSGFKKVRQDMRKLKKKKSSMPREEYKKALLGIRARKNALWKKCNSPEGNVKLKEIATGILRKNAPIQNSYNEKQKVLKNLLEGKEDLQRAYDKLNPKNNNSRGGYVYQVSGNLKEQPYLTPKLETNILAGVLAKISGKDDKWASLVMRKKPDDVDDWEWLSEAEKAEIRANLDNIDRY